MCVCKKESQSDSAASFAIYCTESVHEKKKEIYLLYWFLHFIRHALKATQYLLHCVRFFSELSEEKQLFSLELQAARNCGLWFSHFIKLTKGSLRGLPLLRSLPLSLTTVALRIVICSFPRQPTRTCVHRGLTDIEWHNMKQWLLSQSARIFYETVATFPISMCYVKSQLAKSDNKIIHFYSGFILFRPNTNAWCNIFPRQMDEAN